MRKADANKFLFRFLLFFSGLFLTCVFSGCVSNAASAEEYYSIGMAYYDLGKYDEAEKWLNRARQSDRTMSASTYTLGRLAYERQNYEEAAKYFESILKIDPNNTLALKAAAYSRIMTGELDKAEKHYSKLFELVPESADDGYNHALVLYAMEKYSASLEVLEKYPIALQEGKDVMLLYARNQAALNDIKAIDSYASFLASHSDPKARYEYAKILEKHDLYARALEEYKKALTETSSSTTTDLKKSDVRFSLARVLLIADSSSSEGITELRGSVADGFDDIAAVEDLLNKVSASNRDAVRSIITELKTKSEDNP